MAESEETAILVKRTQGSKLGDLVVDASISEGHTTTIQVLTNPLEEGADIPDHAVVMPDQLTMEVMWSDVVNGAERAAVGRAREQWSTLVGLAKARQGLTVVSGLKVYERMLITSVGTLEDAQSGIALKVSVQLQEFRVAERKTTTLEAPDSSVKHGTKKPKGKGSRKSTKKAKAKAEKESSQLYKLIFQ